MRDMRHYMPAIRRPMIVKLAWGSLSVLSFAVSGSFAHAQDPVFVNGDFSQALIRGTVRPAMAAEFGTTNNGFTPAQQLIGWTTAGYNFVFLPGTADTTGSSGQATVKLWGPDAGANRGINASLLPLSSPNGGNYIGADGAYEISPITQVVSGLEVGENVAVSFVWAGAQQSGYTGATSDEWTVSLGVVNAHNPSKSTNVVSLQTEGASAWMSQTFIFAANSSSELLSFLATGTPSGQPPFALLADVTVTNVPEPASLGIMVTGLLGLTAAAGLRRRPNAVAARAGAPAVRV